MTRHTVFNLLFIKKKSFFLDRQQAKGLDIFVGKYALPVLIFSSLVRLDFSQVTRSRSFMF